MSTQVRLSVASALAVALSCAALRPVYADLGWLVPALGAVVAVSAVSALGRRIGLPAALQPLAGLLGLAGWVSLAFAAGTLRGGLLPAGATLERLRTLVSDGFLDIDELAAPVPTRTGLVLLGVLGVGATTVLVDFLAVTLRQVAVAGLGLLLLFAVPSAVLPGGVGFLPFVLGASGWMLLLLADSGDRVSRWGTPLASSRIADDAALGQVGRRIGVAALGVAVLVPLLVPGLDNNVLGGGGGGIGFGGSSKTTTYNPILRLSGQLRLPEPRPLLTYASDDPAPQYLRLTTLDEFSEQQGWSSSQLSGSVKKDRLEQGLPRPSGLGAADTGRTVDVSVQLTDRLDGPWVPVAFPTVAVDVPGPWLWDAEAETAFSTRRKVSTIDASYTVQAAVAQPSVELLREDQTVPTEITSVYAQPPKLSPGVQQILADVVRGQRTDFDRVVALQAYFQSSRFRYDETASAPSLNTPDALENFLRNKQGYCEQYASAMGALVRALGIPARVAVGFTAGTPIAPGRREVTTSDAHAWPEVWFEGAGWIRFEPTPRNDRTTSIPGYTQPPADAGPSATPSAEPSVAPSTSASVGPAVPNNQGRGGQDGASAASAGAGPSRQNVVTAVVAVAVVLLLLLAPLLLAALRRRRRITSGSPESIWAVVRDDAVDLGHRWRPADSPRACAAHLRTGFRLAAPAAAALGRLAAAVEHDRYARPAAATAADSGATRPLGGKHAGTAVTGSAVAGVGLAGGDLAGGGRELGAGSALGQDAAALRRAMRSDRGRLVRLRAWLAPPTTLRWASGGLGALVADGLDRVDASVAALGRVARRTRVRRAG